MNCSNTTDFCNRSTVMENDVDVHAWVLPPFDASVKNIILAIVLILIDVVTTFGNLLVLIAFVIDRRLLQPFNLFILNLAVTDFSVGVTAMTFYTIDTLLGYWPFGQAMCGVWIYFDFAMTFASVFTLVAISIDRFWCVTWPMHYKMNNSRTRIVIALGIVWLCTVAIWTPPFIGDRLKHNEEYWCIWEPSDNREFVLLVAVIGHYIPCIVMVFCYLKVFYAMRRQASKVATTASNNSTVLGPQDKNSAARSENQRKACRPFSGEQLGNFGPYLGPPTILTGISDTPCDNSNVFITSHAVSNQSSAIYTIVGQSSSDTHSNQHLTSHSQSINNVNRRKRQPHRRHINANGSQNQSKERRIFVTLTYVLSSYLICWFPFYIAFDTYAWRPELVPGELYTFFFWMTYVNSMLNPFIYAYTSKDFRSAFVKVVAFMYRCKT